MFTGIIEALGRIEKIEKEGSNINYWVSTPFFNELKVDQSVAHSGVCLTVVELKDGWHKVTAIDETLKKTSLSAWEKGGFVNLERCLSASGRFDGHIVQGHVDQIGTCISVEKMNGSFVINFKHSLSNNMTVEKGSICINGISLTVFNSKDTSFSVAIIPYTWENTNLKYLRIGDSVNLEFDILGKYIARMFLKNS